MNAAQPLSRREAGKLGRRTRILAAARRMIEESGAEALSIRELVKEAGVSQATIYAICGSKAAIFVALIEEDRAEFRQVLTGIAGADPFERLFTFIERACRVYVLKEPFYRAIFTYYFSSGGLGVRETLDSGRHSLWYPFVQSLGEAGLLLPIDPHILSDQLEDIFMAAHMRWCLQGSGIDHLEAETGLGVAMALRGLTGPDHAGYLADKIMGFAETLRTLRQAATA